MPRDRGITKSCPHTQNSTAEDGLEMTLPRHDLHSVLTTARGTCYTPLTMLRSTGQTATRHATREPTTVALRYDGGRRSDLATTPRRLQLFRHRGRHDVFYTLASPRYHGNTNRHGTTNTGARRKPFLHSPLVVPATELKHRTQTAATSQA